jgi:hypothetical protein
MNLQLLRSALFEITKKPSHNASDIIAMQVIGLQINQLFVSKPELAKTKEAASFAQYLFKEMRRVLKTAKDNYQTKPDEESETTSGTEG